MKSIEKAKLISADKDQLDSLIRADNFYLVLGDKPDDCNLLEFNRHINFSYWKLRGPHNGPYHLANNRNDHEFMHGYVYQIDDADINEFEKEVTIASLKTGYRVEKYSCQKEYEILNTNHFNTLFEI